MGAIMSLVGRGPMNTEMLTVLSGTLYENLLEKNIQTFDDFHIAILDIFNTFNSALPGKHYDAPARFEIEGIHKHWVEANEARKKEIFEGLMLTKVKLNKIDTTTMITGVVTPPVAMVAKRAGEKVPQLNIIKAIPDVIFVPTATVVALFSVKISRRILASMRKSQDQQATL